MDEFLATVGIQAMRYAIRSGIALTSTYALGQCSRLLNSVEDKKLYSRLKTLRKLLDGKIRIISPAIDLIEFKSGRGNVFLESAVPLAKSLHKEIVSLGRRIEIVVGPEELTANPGQPNPLRGRPEDLVAIIKSIEELLSRIDREIPLLQLAISASGESLSTQLPAGVSPSRLLQASTFLIVGDTQFAQDPSRPVQIGPVFTLSLYMLFLGHASSQPPSSNEVSPIGDANDTGSFPQIPNNEVPYGLEEGARKPLWKEVLHKARVRLCRTRADYVFDSIVGYRPDSRDPNGSPDPFSPHLPVAEGDEYAYHLEIIEDLDDGRLHDNDHKHNPSHYDDIATAGIRESIPIHQVSKIFYTDTGRILNIGNATDGEQNPVLLLKRDSQAAPNWNGTGGFAECLEYANSEDGSVTSEMIDGDDEQDSIDKQLMREFVTTKAVSSRTLPQSSLAGYKFPSHLDPEWIALEVFEEDDEESIEDDEDDEDDDTNTIDSAEMEGFRFWKQGYWANYLRGLPYHISALYVVDLHRFRQIAAGDRLRQTYQALSADPNSLANLDQDLPNHMQFNLPIHSLPQEWLWCETWCSDDTLASARTIDLCNNPQTKEPKLDRARRQVPEWTVYDDEIAALDRRRRSSEDTASTRGEGKSVEPNSKSRTLEEKPEHTLDEL